MPTETTEPELSRSETLEIQRAGYRAYLAGESPKDNPYTRETEEDIQRQSAWFRGYAASKTDRARANRESTKTGSTDTGSSQGENNE